MVTVKDLVLQANSLADDTFDNADWYAWFNACLQDLAQFIKVEDIITIPVEVGKAEYTLSTGIMEVNLVKLGTQTLSLKNIDSLEVGYYVYGNKLYLTNVPQETSTLYLFVVRVPNTITSDFDTPEIPEEFSYLLPIFGCYRAQLKDDEPDRAAAFLGEYKEGKASLMEYMKKRKRNVTGKVYAFKVVR